MYMYVDIKEWIPLFEKWYLEKVARCFADVDMILHAGDLTSLMAPVVGADGHIVLSDINAAMLRNGRGHLLD